MHTDRQEVIGRVRGYLRRVIGSVNATTTRARPGHQETPGAPSRGQSRPWGGEHQGRRRSLVIGLRKKILRKSGSKDHNATQRHTGQRF